ncbi:MAG: response regulator transcription factor [Propionibacteriaceae bacterium]|nr:response regulator transcription factor [Propionibacteriaceae bacterium]
MISLLLAEHYAAVREAFATILDLQDDITVVATAATVREGVNLAWLHQPHTALVDVRMPPDTGFSMLEQLHTAAPNCRSIMLASADVPNHLRQAFEHGAWAYVTTNAPFSDIVDVIKDVHAGKKLINPDVIHQGRLSPLSMRETQVLRVVGRVGTTAEVSKEMNLSRGTINNYMSSILCKLGVTGRVQAVNLARHNGWL